MKIFIKYLGWILLSITVLITVTGFIIARFYQDEVKQVIINQINSQVQTEIKVGDLSFSVLRKFPYASLEFRDVLICTPADFDQYSNAGPGTDTLFTAANLFLQFSIRDLFRKQYSINAVHANRGVIYLAVNEHEQENYRFWESSSREDQGEILDLRDLRLNGYRVVYSNILKDVHSDTDISRLALKGTFNRSEFVLQAVAEADNRSLKTAGLSLGEIRGITARLTMNVDEQVITIEQGSVDLAGIKLTADGQYIRSSPGYADIRIGGHSLDMERLTSLMPAFWKNAVEDWRFSGKFDFAASIEGELGKSVSPSVFASFSTGNSEVRRKNTGAQLKGMSLEGYYTNGKSRNASTSSMVIEGFSGNTASGRISGHGSITGFIRPEIDFKIEADLDIRELSEFYLPKNITEVTGRINTNFNLKGYLAESFSWGTAGTANLSLEGRLDIAGGRLVTGEGRYIATDINGRLDFGKVFRTQGLDFNIGNDHFRLAGEINNGLPWLLGNDATIQVSGGLHSRNLDLGNYIKPASTARQEGEEERQLVFPYNVEVDLDFIVNELKYNNFESTDFRGRLSYKPRMMVLNSVEFNSMSGMVSGNGVIAQRVNGEFIVQTRLSLEGVDMQKMFLSFNNFGQSFIHGDNMKGRLTGDVSLISEWDSGLRIMWEKLIADSKLEIRTGELINFEPMMGLARFIEVSELQHIRFSTLNNEIFIRNQVVTIPQMDINSSAFNISGSGTHNFDGNFDYRLRVLLSDVLYGRARNAKPENQKFGIIEDDGLGRTSLYLRVSGTTADYRVAYDHRAVRDVLLDNIASERQVLRRILNEEFGWFRSDTTLVREAPQVTTSSGFRIKWDEADEQAAPVTEPAQPGQRQPRTNRRFEMIWDEEEKPPGDN